MDFNSSNPGSNFQVYAHRFISKKPEPKFNKKNTTDVINNLLFEEVNRIKTNYNTTRTRWRDGNFYTLNDVNYLIASTFIDYLKEQYKEKYPNDALNLNDIPYKNNVFIEIAATLFKKYRPIGICKNTKELPTKEVELKILTNGRETINNIWDVDILNGMYCFIEMKYTEVSLPDYVIHTSEGQKTIHIEFKSLNGKHYLPQLHCSTFSRPCISIRENGFENEGAPLKNLNLQYLIGRVVHNYNYSEGALANKRSRNMDVGYIQDYQSILNDKFKTMGTIDIQLIL